MCYGETLSAAIVRARKQHECDECQRQITPGMRYYRSFAKDGREVSHMKLCRTCYTALTVNADSVGCWWLTGTGNNRDALRSAPWRETLAWMRGTWQRARGRTAYNPKAPKEVSGG